MPSRSITSLARNWVISAGRAPLYAQSQGTHRLAASSGVRVSVIASDARKIVRHSSGKKALVSRSVGLRVTSIVTSRNGLRGMRLCLMAHLNTALHGAIQFLRTVPAYRLLARLFIHSCASSGLIEAALRP